MYSSLFAQLQKDKKISVNILVFRTNLNTRADVEVITPVLDGSSAILTWSVDIEDIDKVLRIESFREDASEIKEIIRLAGYQCEELAD